MSSQVRQMKSMRIWGKSRGVHVLRSNIKGDKMDCVVWKLVSGKEMLLVWKSGNFHTADAHTRFGNSAEPANLGKQWGNDFFLLPPYDLL